MRTQKVIWDHKSVKLGDRLNDLTAWGVTENDVKAWGVIWERKLNKIGDKLMI